MTRKLMIGSSIISMTAAERTAGRYMRAPDHPQGGGDGDGAAAAEPTGGEVNDAVVVDGDDGHEFNEQGSSQDPAWDDSHDTEGGEGEKGEEPPKPAEPDLAARLAELERANAERERDLEYWRGRAEGTINEDGTPVSPPPQEDGDIPPDDPDRPKPEDYQYGETDAAYIRDLARYEARAAYAEEQAQHNVRQQLEAVETAHSERVGKAKERYADYDEVVVAGANPDPLTKEPKWFCSPLMSLGIKTSEFGPDIAYALASNPEESKRIAKLAPLEQAKEFGRLEYRAEMELKGSESGSEHRVTGAPPPPPRARGAGGRSEVPADTDDFAAFEQRADAHLKTKKRR
jgi:hypothetical protein